VWSEHNYSLGEYEMSRSRKEEIEELREVFNAISEFLMNLKQPIKELLEMTMSALDGKKLGEEVASFYESLVSRGTPKELAESMAKEFLRRKLESIPNIGEFVKSFKLGTRKYARMGLDEAIETLERIKDMVPPESRKNIEEAISTLKGLKKPKEEGEEGS